MYRTIHTIFRYDTIHTIRTLYRTIHEHLRYGTFYTRYDTYHTIRIAYLTILTTMVLTTMLRAMPYNLKFHFFKEQFFKKNLKIYNSIVII